MTPFTYGKSQSEFPLWGISSEYPNTIRSPNETLIRFLPSSYLPCLPWSDDTIVPKSRWWVPSVSFQIILISNLSLQMESVNYQVPIHHYGTLKCWSLCQFILDHKKTLIMMLYWPLVVGVLDLLMSVSSFVPLLSLSQLEPLMKLNQRQQQQMTCSLCTPYNIKKLIFYFMKTHPSLQFLHLAT